MKIALNKSKSILLILLGNFLYAVAVHFFLVPADLATGGVTGIAIALNEVTGVAVSIYAMIFNVIMWFVGLILLGKFFAMATLLGTFSYPIFLNLIERCVGSYVFTSDRLLCTVFGGILIGVGLGLTMRENASTGGMDVVPLALNKFFRLPISWTMNILDVIIVLAQLLVFPPESLMYGIMNIMVYSIVLDKVLVFGQGRIEIKVISPQCDAITQFILTEVDRGVTLLSAAGGYTHDPQQIVMSVVSNRELARIEKRIHEIDANALLIVSKVTEVRGRGFTMEKLYR